MHFNLQKTAKLLILLCFFIPIGLNAFTPADDDDANGDDKPAAPEGIVFQNDSASDWTIKFKMSGEMGAHKFEDPKPVSGSSALKLKVGAKTISGQGDTILKKKTATKVELVEEAKSKDKLKAVYFTVTSTSKKSPGSASFAMSVSDGAAKLYLEKAAFVDSTDVADVIDINKPGDGSFTIKAVK
ncbi:MAG: hypothetical protein P4L36_19580 [Holophaga sp.]|nr:hypothetical protein [Holophaga sp.]